MNAVPNPPSNRIDWVINYVEVNSQPVCSTELIRLQITDGFVRIDPAGISLAIRESTPQGIILDGAEGSTYLCNIVQRGSELVVDLQRSGHSDRVLIVAKKSICEFEPCNSAAQARSSVLTLATLSSGSAQTS